MKILITGAYGFVGSNLSRFLAARGHVCDALDLPSAKRPDLPYSSFYSWDALAAGQVPLASYAAIVHLAGKAHDLKKTANPESYFTINVGLTEKLFSRVDALDGQRPRFIYFSSIKAVDGDTPYAKSKQAAEVYLAGRAIVLRPAMIHGPGNKGNLNLLYAIARRGLPWPLAAFENLRSFTSVENISAVVEALCERGENGVYPMADDQPISTNRIIELIAESTGRKARLWRLSPWLMRLAARLGDFLPLPLDSERFGKLTANAVVDNTPLKRALGWTTMPIAAEDGMRSTLKSFTR